MHTCDADTVKNHHYRNRHRDDCSEIKQRLQPVFRVFDDGAVGEEFPTFGYLTMLGNVNRREGCVLEVADDVIVVVMVTG